MFTIYSIVHVPTQRRYVGATKQPLAMRLGQHRYAAAHRPTNPLHLEMRASGRESFAVDVLETVGNLPAADEAEKWWIAHFGANDPRFGFNIEAGGRKKGTAPLATRAKMSAAWTPERIAEHRKAREGYTLSAEARRTIGDKARQRAEARHAAGILPMSPQEYYRRYRERHLERVRERDRAAHRRRYAARRVRQ